MHDIQFVSFNVFMRVPVDNFQILIVLSYELVAIMSSDNATIALTLFE